jgi:hypothetical protein
MGILSRILAKAGIVYFTEPWFRRKLHLSNSPYMIKKDKEQGEKELTDLVNSANREGAWVYSHDDSYWYNIGYSTFRTKQTEERGSSLGVMTYSMDFSQLGNQVTHYHIHPFCMEREISDSLILGGRSQGIDEKDGKRWNGLNEFARTLAAVRASFPMNKDVETYLDTLRDNPNCQIDFKVVSSHGITTVNIDPTKDTLSNILQRYQIAFKNIILDRAVELYSDKDPNSAIDTAVNTLNQQMNGLLTLSMEYHNHPQ